MTRPVVGRSDLDDIRADELEPAQGAQESDGLGRREARHLGRSRARRKRGIEEVDIEREEDGAIADALAHGSCIAVGPERAQLFARDDGESERPRVVEVGRGIQ